MKDVSTPRIEMLLSSVGHMSPHLEAQKWEENVISTGPVEENVLSIQSLEKSTFRQYVHNQNNVYSRNMRKYNMKYIKKHTLDIIVIILTEGLRMQKTDVQ